MPPMPTGVQSTGDPFGTLGGGGAASVVSHPTGFSNDPFALPANNPFTQLQPQATGYVPAHATGVTDIFANAAQAPAAIPPMPTGYGGGITAQATGNPFAPAPQPMQQAGGGFLAPFQATNPTGGSFSGVPSHSTGNPFAFAAPEQRPASTPPIAKPMVDLNNLGPPNRNPFAMTNSGAGIASPATGGGFNWSGQQEGQKPSLAELQSQRTGFNQVGFASTGPAGFGAPGPSPFGAQPTGFAAPQPQRTAQTGQNPFF
jgi:hypothetical protein